MTKEHAQGVFIRFIDFRGELLLRASAIDGVVPSEKNAATYVVLIHEKYEKDREDIGLFGIQRD
ncbi:TPA: hypothetical protein HNO31_14330 [Escherichia coli]|nr:hypothetical protein [Escherichia coli]